MGVFEVWSHVHVLDRNQGCVELNLAHEQVAQFALQQFVDPFKSVFGHSMGRGQEWRTPRCPVRLLELLGNLFQDVTLDDVALFVLVEGAELDAAFHSVADLFDVVLESPECGEPAVVDGLAPA